MQIINVPEEYIIEARETLYFEDAVKNIVKSLVDEMVAKHFQIAKLWAKVEVEALKQGIVKTENQAMKFDHISSTFQIIDQPVMVRRDSGGPFK